MNCAELNLVHLELTVHTDHPKQLLSRLPLLGGKYAIICRSLVCSLPDTVCRDCRRSDTCGWHCLFAQELSTDPAELKRHQKPPLPFVFTFPDAAADTDSLTIGLVVIGTAVHHLDLLLEGISQLMEDLTARLQSAVSLDYQGTAVPFAIGERIVHPDNLHVLSAGGVLESRPIAGDLLKIQLLSPLRIMENGRMRHEFDFGVFARSLMRRISSLVYYYGACTFDVDFGELAQQANGVKCRENRFTYLPGSDRRLSGVGGYGVFEGSMDGIMPFLVLGQLLHGGKGAAFGSGRYVLSVVNR